MRAQAALLALGPAVDRAADDALARDVNDLRSGAIELEIHAVAHRRAGTRFFST
jgi:urease accessory protein UreF